MACQFDSLDRLVADYGTPNVPQPLAPISYPGSPSLLVSNAPEQIGSGIVDDLGSGNGQWLFGSGPKNLCRVHLFSNSIPSKVRVFLWHISRFQVPSYFGLIIGAGTSASATIGNVKLQLENQNHSITDLSTPGRCLASAQLFGTLDPQNTPPVTALYGGEQVVWSTSAVAGSLDPNSYKLIAAIIEFDVLTTGVASPELTIRTSISLTGQGLADFGSYGTDLADTRNNFGALDRIHVRGYWPSANLDMSLPGELNATLVQPTRPVKEWEYCADNGPEASYFSVANSLADKGIHEKPNKGAYGANLTYFATYRNYSLDTSGLVHVGLQARNVGDTYFGAARLSTTIPSPQTYGSAVKIQPMPNPNTQPPPANVPIYRFCELTSVYPAGANSGHIGVAPSTTGTAMIQIANGGGAATPTNIVMWPDVVMQNPAEGAG